MFAISGKLKAISEATKIKFRLRWESEVISRRVVSALTIGYFQEIESDPWVNKGRVPGIGEKKKNEEKFRRSSVPASLSWFIRARAWGKQGGASRAEIFQRRHFILFRGIVQPFMKLRSSGRVPEIGEQEEWGWKFRSSTVPAPLVTWRVDGW
jgi:hypothetical protein